MHKISATLEYVGKVTVGQSQKEFDVCGRKPGFIKFSHNFHCN